MKLWYKFKSLFINEPRKPKTFWIPFPTEVESEQDKQDIIASTINHLQNKITVS